MPKVREHEYATWIKCRLCKEKREEEGHKDLMISKEQMKKESSFWHTKALEVDNDYLTKRCD